MPQTSKSSSKQRAQEIHVALLRGINVGGKNKLPMADLVAMFSDLKCTGVQTYIQSGNVIFCAARGSSGAIARQIAAKIAAKFGYEIPIVVRSLAELHRAMTNNPFLKSGEDEAFLHIGFLADTPAIARVNELDGDRSPGDSFAVVGSEIYMCLPNGVGRSKLTNAYFDSKLKTISTFRNLRTVRQLIAIAEGEAELSGND